MSRQVILEFPEELPEESVYDSEILADPRRSQPVETQIVILLGALKGQNVNKLV